MAKPVALVLGSSGQVGKAIVCSLSESYSDKVDIKACTRHPDKASDLASLPSVEVIAADMGTSTFDEIIKPFNAVSACIVTPGHENPAPIVAAAAKACKSVGVKSVCVFSDISAALTGESATVVLTSMFRDVEDAVKDVGVAYTIFRLPFFFENLYYSAERITANSEVFSPARPDAPFTGIAVTDIGKAAAAVLVNPSAHANKIYNLGSNAQTFDDIANAFTQSLERKIEYVKVPYEKFKQFCVDTCWPEWTIDGVVGYFKAVDRGSSHVVDTSAVATYTSITGLEPLTVQQWVTQQADVFKERK